MLGIFLIKYMEQMKAGCSRVFFSDSFSLESLKKLGDPKKSPPVYREDEQVPEMNKNWQLNVVNLSAPRDGETNG